MAHPPAIPEEDSGSVETLIVAFGIVASNLERELERYRSGHRTQGHCLHTSTIAAALADIARQLDHTMKRAAGEFIPSALLSGC